MSEARLKLLGYRAGRAHPYEFEGECWITTGATSRYHQVYEWCLYEFGSPGLRWTYDLTDTFKFRDHSDAFQFRMRWC